MVTEDPTRQSGRPGQQEKPGKAEKARESGSRTVIPQTQLPVMSLSKALAIPQALFDHFAGKSAVPLHVAMSLDISPTSSGWRSMTGASIAYGLTEGGYGAPEIGLTALGRTIVAPEDEGQDATALRQAALKPKYVGDFLKKYDRAKLPAKTIGCNVLMGMGVPKERVDQAFDVIVETAKFAGLIQETKTGPFVSLAAPIRAPETETSMARTSKSTEVEDEVSVEDFAKQVAGEPELAAPPSRQQTPSAPVRTNRVYISHGKHREIVHQLKEILTFGKYEPVVSVELETTSIPVPDKVLDDMRSCSAGIINVHSEGEWMDREGNKRVRINDNVLIEIGAAMALYGKRYILLVQNGVSLPSNLQGLYRCEYEGEKLDFETTMKLLRTFNEFDKA